MNTSTEPKVGGRREVDLHQDSNTIKILKYRIFTGKHMRKVYLVKKSLEIVRVNKYFRKLTIDKVQERLKKRINKFKRYGFNVNDLVLDVGTASGIDLLALFSTNPEIEGVGIDVSKQALKFAKRILPNKSSNLIQADVLHLPFRKGVFNNINVSYMLHHHPLKLLRKVVMNLKSVLRKNGTIFIKEPSVESERDAIRREIHTLRHGLEKYAETKKVTKSKKLQQRLIDSTPIFHYDTAYSSLLTNVFAENNLKIETFKIVREKFGMKESGKLLKEVIKQIERSNLTEDEKAYLFDKVQALEEKLVLIKPIGEKSIILIVKKL